MPFMVARRSRGYHSTKARIVDIRQPDTPRPISARAAIASAAECAEANQAPPRGGDQQQGRVHAPRPEAVEQQPERQLEQGEGQEVHAGEQPQAAGAEAELDGERGSEHRVHRAVHVRDEEPRDERQRDAEEDQFFGASMPPR